jgi:hypothetical protein
VDRIRIHRDAIAVAAAFLLPLAVAAVLVPFRETFANAAAALVLVAVVVAVATLGTRTAGFIAAGSASLWFDFFLTRPYERFAITQRPDIETAISLFVVGMVVTELAARSRHHHQVAAEESDYVELIYGVSELVASGAPTREVIDRVRGELIELLHLRDCRYEAGAPLRRMTRIEHDGQVLLGGLLWGVHEMGLPGRELELLVQSRGHVLGRFLIKPTPAWPVSLRRRVVAVALADQAGAALTPRLRSA